MPKRWICLAVLLAAIAATACEKKKPPADQSPPYPAPMADAAAAPAAEPAPQPPPAADAAAEPAEPAPTPDPGKAEPGKDPAPTPEPGKEPRPGKDPKPGKPTAGGERPCGGIAGFKCKASEKCRYAQSTFAPRHPDDMGACVAETYCDAATDCAKLIHPMVLGKWACEQKGCAWKAEAGAPQ